MASSPATKSGTKRLSEAARVVVKPEGIVSTGWRDVETVCRRMGLPFDEWQRGVGRIVLAKRKDGKLASMIGGVGLSLPRQVGKTYLMSGLLFALCILRPGTLAIWTAHHGKTHEETFLSMQGFATRLRVAPYIQKVYTGSGDEEVRFNNGSRILFGARDAGFGRGIPGVDIIVFDEAQILTERALDAMLATMNTSQFGLALYIGTPPRPTDPSETFSRMRSEALSGKLENAAWIECGADKDADPNDQEQWAKANPSFPERTPAESIMRLQSKLTEDSFKREALGIWDADGNTGVIPAVSWLEREDPDSVAVDRLTLGVEVGPDLTWASVALAGERADGKWHFEVDEDQHTKGRGIAWLVPHVRYLVANNPQIRGVMVDVTGPIKAILDERNKRWFFKGTDFEVTPVKTAELGPGCTNVLDGIVTGWLHHIGQPQFTAAALAAMKRDLADSGMWVWQRKLAESDITPIQAGTLALIGAQAEYVKKPTPSGRGRRVVSF